MADTKISALTALATPASDDVLPIVDTSANATKKITVEDLLAATSGGLSGLTTGQYLVATSATTASTDGGALGPSDKIVASFTINLNTANAVLQDIYTVPAGKNFLPTRFYLHSATTDISAADGGELQNSGDSSTLLVLDMSSLTAADKIIQATLVSAITRVSAGNKVQFFSYGAIGSAQTVRIELFGILIDQ